MNTTLLEHEKEQYAAHLARCDSIEADIKELLSDSEKAGDQETVWFCKAQLADLGRTRASIRKPGEPRT